MATKEDNYNGNNDLVCLAKTIDSELDPALHRQKLAAEIMNLTWQSTFLGDEEIIPVGSCVDGSKVNTPGDIGDVDYLIVSNTISLNEELFDYDSRHPAFLYIRMDGEHKKVFQSVTNPVNKVYLPTSALKELHRKFYCLVRTFIKCETIQGRKQGTDRLSVNRNSSVGLENTQLDVTEHPTLGSKSDRDKRALVSSKIGDVVGTLSRFLFDLTSVFENEKDQQVNKRQSGKEGDESLSDLRCSGGYITQKQNHQRGDLISDIIGQAPTKPLTRTVCIVDDISEDHYYRFENDIDFTDDGIKENTTFENVTKEDLKETNPKTSGKVLFKITSTDRNTNHSKKEDRHGQLNRFVFLNTRQSNTETKSAFDGGEESIEKNQDYLKHKLALRQLKSTDFVPAFKFKGWPRTATEWLTRSRKWPAKTVVKEVAISGCHVVAKRPRDIKSTSEKSDPYFRLSFALSETILARSMNTPQMLCWRILKAYQKKYLGTSPKILSYYHWKNVIFWISEEEDGSYWIDDNLLDAVMKCLVFMKTCLLRRCVPFYFVRTMNLIHGCDDRMIEDVYSRVCMIVEDPVRFLWKFIENPPIPKPFYVDDDEIEKISSDETNKLECLDLPKELLESLFRRYRYLCEASLDEEGFGEKMSKNRIKGLIRTTGGLIQSNPELFGILEKVVSPLASVIDSYGVFDT